MPRWGRPPHQSRIYAPLKWHSEPDPPTVSATHRNSSYPVRSLIKSSAKILSKPEKSPRTGTSSTDDGCANVGMLVSLHRIRFRKRVRTVGADIVVSNPAAAAF